MKLLNLFKLEIACSLLIFNLLFVTFSEAQTPQFYNYNTPGLGNAYPFNVAAGKRIQVLYRAGDFNQPSPAVAGNITSVSFMIGNLSLGPFTYSDFVIKMGQTDLINLVNGEWYSGQLDTVYYRPTVTLSSPAAQWLTIQLDRQFAYDPSQSLVIDVQQCGANGASGFSSATTILLTQVRRNTSSAGTFCPFIWGESTGVVHHIGITLGLTGTQNQNIQIPSAYNLSQNYPNPFNPSTRIRYDIPEIGYVKLSVYDILGREIVTLVNELQTPGTHEVTFESTSLTSGIYLYKLITERFTDTKRMLLIK